MPITWQAEDTTEPIADTTIEGIANFQNYSTVSGCGASYNGATMVVAIAAGSVLHNGSVVAVAGNNVTLVSDATNPRWTWIGISSVGVATIISGTPAAAPTVPELGDYVCSQLVLVQANLTIATNATAKLDKRVIYTPTKTVLTTTGDSLYASGANTEARLAIGTTNQALTVVAGVPAWRASATSVLTTTADVLYASAANVLARLGIGSTGQALTVFGGLPAWRASATSVLTTTGDVLYASSANTLARRGIGSTGQVITVAGGVPTWATPSASEWVLVSSGAISATNIDLTSLSGYKRYRLSINVSHTTSSTPIGPFTAQLNGVTGSGYMGVGMAVRSQTAAATTNPYLQNFTGSFAMSGGLSVNVTGASRRAALIELTVSADTAISSKLQALWDLTANTNDPSTGGVLWSSGGGMLDTAQASITSIKVMWDSTSVGLYILEGSNS